MKEIDELHLPGDIYYTKDHEWARQENDVIRVGITDYAQDQMGDIVFVELPEVGSNFSQGSEFGTLESVKAVSEIFVPVTGEVVEINEALEDSPELLNEDPYNNWIVTIRPAQADEYEALLSREDYLELLKG